jgi:hypothetical protein
MERVQGCQLSEVWPTMSERQRFALVKSLVEIEKRPLSIKFAAHGSVYYKSTYPDGPNAISLDQLPSSKQEAGSRFVIGPTTERSFFVDGSHGQRVDQGPCECHYETIHHHWDHCGLSRRCRANGTGISFRGCKEGNIFDPKPGG